MMNKKIVLSLLTLGMLAIVASAGTYAYLQDTINVNNNGVTTQSFDVQYRNDGHVGKSPASGADAWVSLKALPNGVATITNSIQAPIAFDGTTYADMDHSQLEVKNNNPDNPTGSTINNIDIYLKVVPVLQPAVADLWIRMGNDVDPSKNTIIYDCDDSQPDGHFLDTSTTKIVDGLTPGSIKNLNLQYYLQNQLNVNQNSQAGQTVSFNYVLYIVPHSTTTPTFH